MENSLPYPGAGWKDQKTYWSLWSRLWDAEAAKAARRAEAIQRKIERLESEQAKLKERLK